MANAFDWSVVLEDVVKGFVAEVVVFVALEVFLVFFQSADERGDFVLVIFLDDVVYVSQLDGVFFEDC